MVSEIESKLVSDVIRNLFNVFDFLFSSSETCLIFIPIICTVTITLCLSSEKLMVQRRRNVCEGVSNENHYFRR